MADISQIKLPNGTTYDIKDVVARSSSGGVDFIIVNSLPTSGIDEKKVYLISTNFDSSVYLTEQEIRAIIDDVINDTLGVSY